MELTRAFLDVKVIAMSGSCTEDLQTATLIGARRTFTKPLDLPALLHAVHYELQQLHTNGLTSHQSLSLLERLGGIIELGQRLAKLTTH